MRALLFVVLLYAAVAPPLAGQSLPFTEAFTAGMTGWTALDDAPTSGGPGAWSVSQGVLTQSSNVYTTADEYVNFTGTHIWAGSTQWRDYSYNVQMRSTDDDGIGILFRYKDAKNYYRFIMVQDAANKGPFQRLQKRVNGVFTTLRQSAPAVSIPDNWYSLTADVRGSTITMYVNGEMWGSVVDADIAAGAVGLMCYANNGGSFDSVMVTDTLHVFVKPGMIPSIRVPHLRLASPTSMGIGWNSATPAAGRIEYGTTPSMGTVWEESAAVYRHEAQLAGLKESTRYYYRVFDNGTPVTDVLSFSTVKPVDADTVTFLAWGDSGVNNATQYSIARLMEKESADFGIHVGDVSQSNGSEYDLTFFTPYRNLLARIPVYPCIGNHDTYFDNAQTYLREFSLPRNNPQSTERYYTQRTGGVFSIVMDSNIDFTPASAQYQWLIGALGSAERKQCAWTVVSFHHPAYCEAWPEYPGDMNVRTHLVPVFERYGVDLVLNGHTHAYERGTLGGVTYIITGGGGGGLDVFGRDVGFITVMKLEHHYTKVQVVADTMTIVARNITSAVIDSFRIVKKLTDVRSEGAQQPPGGFDVSQSYPNPFNPTTRITYTMPYEGHVNIRVFDAIGRIVAELHNAIRPAGRYDAEWNADNPSGVYYCRVETRPVSGLVSANHAVRSMVLVK